MGGNPRPGRWTPAQWRAKAETVAAIRREGWPAYAICMACALQMKVNLPRIERERGAGFVLWGTTAPCRRLRCEGRAIFMLEPPRANGPVPML